MKKRLAALGAAVIVAALAVAGCGGDGEDDTEAIEKAIRAMEQAWNDKDYDAFAAVHTEDGLQSQLADTGEDVETEEDRQAAFDLLTEEDRAVVSDIRDVVVDDDTATARIEAYNESREEPAPSSLVLGITVALRNESGEWKIDGIEFGEPDTPDGARTVRVEANEFAFAPEEDEFDTGNLVFVIENAGQQPHHVVIERVPDDLDVEAALQSEDEPDGLVHIGATPPWEPGESATIVFSNDLEPGRYVMLCFMPDTDDPEGPPHALKGMYRDFHVN